MRTADSTDHDAFVATLEAAVERGMRERDEPEPFAGLWIAYDADERAVMGRRSREELEAALQETSRSWAWIEYIKPDEARDTPVSSVVSQRHRQS